MKPAVNMSTTGTIQQLSPCLSLRVSRCVSDGAAP